MSADAIFSISVVLMLAVAVIGWFVCKAFERAIDLEEQQ